MKIGIGISLAKDPKQAAMDAVAQARRGAPNPGLALVFGSIHLDQAGVYEGLTAAGLDASIIVGGSSYAEISPAGVTRRSLAVMLVELPGVDIQTVSVPLQDNPEAMSQALFKELGGEGPREASIRVGLLFTSMSASWANDMLASLREKLPGVAMFGGMACGNYDLGMSHPEFWPNYQYCGGALQDHIRLAVLSFPKDKSNVAFGVGHGWETLGPSHTVTRSDGATVFEVDGMPVIDFYRQFLGRDADEKFFELMIQRYGLALQLEGSEGSRTTVKSPVKIDREEGSMTFYPGEDMAGREVNLIQANRKSLIDGARRAAAECLAALDGKKPSLVIAVSCSQRGSILHSRSDAEIEAVREVLGKEVPIIGWYSGGEIVPFLNRYEDIIDDSQKLAGTGFHGTTIGLLALASEDPVTRVVLPEKAGRSNAGVNLEQMLTQSEETLDNTEAFLSNMSRQVYHDGERIRAQSQVLHRYTPHDVWNQAGESAERGEYEIADSEFNGAFLFMDVKGFTAYSENHSPQEVVRSLNALFEPATAIIYENGGDVDKYMGDCIFAAFTDKTGAVVAGSRILALFREVRAAGNPFNVRIGINAGRAIRANVGGVDRREYTFIGDAVNLAQRLESNSAPGKMLISEDLFHLVASRIGPAEKKVITVKGKQAALTVYECGPPD